MAYHSLTEWKAEFLKSNVQPKELTSGGDFLSSETLVLISGPPRRTAEDFSLEETVPIGLVQNVQVSQNKQIQQLYEIGSRIPYMIPGRTIISAGLSRVLFDGPSLMKALAFHKVESGKPNLNSDILDEFKTSTPMSYMEQPSAPEITGPDSDNSGKFFINLASAFFNLPLGLGFVLYDGERDAYGGFYLNECYVQNHAFQAAAAQTVLVENVSLRVTDMIPLSAEELV